MKMYKASNAPSTLAIQAGQLGQAGICVMAEPVITIKTAMLTGASTGPHQGSGIRKRISQSDNETGHPLNTVKYT